MTRREFAQALIGLSITTLLRNQPHPRYAAEKTRMCTWCPITAWGLLDEDNQYNVRAYFINAKMDEVFTEMLSELNSDYWNMPAPQYREKWGLDD